jgi:excisionase family DNA binding protein
VTLGLRVGNSTTGAPVPGRAKNSPPEPLLISVKETAIILGLSRNHTYALLDLGVIDSRYIGRRRLVLKSSLDEFVAHLPRTPPGRE